MSFLLWYPAVIEESSLSLIITRRTVCFAEDYRSAGCLATLKRFVLVLGSLVKTLILQATNAYPSDQ